jgi:predicted branched-subunit amino acid permease
MRDFRRGLLSTLPLAPGVVAFGLLYGVMARQVGLRPLQRRLSTFWPALTAFGQ